MHLPVLVPTASHPLAHGGFSVGIPTPAGLARATMAGFRIGEVGADLVAADGTPTFGRTYPTLTCPPIRDAARALDSAVSALLDARGPVNDARAGGQSIGILLAYAGAPFDSRNEARITLYAGDTRSEAVRDATLKLNGLIRAAG